MFSWQRVVLVVACIGGGVALYLTGHVEAGATLLGGAFLGALLNKPKQ